MSDSLFVNQDDMGEWQGSPVENNIFVGDGQENLPENSDCEESPTPQETPVSEPEFNEPRPADQRAEEFLTDWLRRIRRNS